MIKEFTPTDSELETLSTDAKMALDMLALKDYKTAIKILKNILARAPYHAPSWNNLGFALASEGLYTDALESTKKALELDPSDIIAIISTADCLVQTNKLNEAIMFYAKAIERESSNITYRCKYASALREAGKLKEALAQIEEAQNIDPHDAMVNWQLSLIHLKNGDFAAGWKGYEMRWRTNQLESHKYKAPLWAGENLTGKSILLHEEQGFGDTILAARYIPLVKERGAQVILGCRTQLHDLFRYIPGLDNVTDGGSFHFDYHAPLMSLPRIFDTTLDTIPPPAHLTPAKTLSHEVSSLLNLKKDHFKVGIVWSGSTSFKNNHRRAVSLAHFLPLAKIPGIQLYSLQKGPPEKELSEENAESLIFELGSHLNDFAKTAAVIEKLDIVIMTDSSVAHLAGSLGRPIWNLLSYNAYWLYLSDREDSPWYPSMRLFRQPHPGDWGNVFIKVAEELVKAVALKKYDKCS